MGFEHNLTSAFTQASLARGRHMRPTPSGEVVAIDEGEACCPLLTLGAHAFELYSSQGTDFYSA